MESGGALYDSVGYQSKQRVDCHDSAAVVLKDSSRSSESERGVVRCCVMCKSIQETELDRG